jgi:hypothetical protein
METKDWKTTSASQIKTFKRCARLWWFDKICDEVEKVYDEKQLATFRYGTLTHERIEDFLNGESDTLSQDPFVEVGRPYLNKIKPWVVSTEESLILPTRHIDVSILGFVDVELLQGIVDHKTTSHPKWALDERDLKIDPQVNLYLAWKLFDNAKRGIYHSELEGTLNYLQKPGRNRRPKNWQVSIQKSSTEIEEVYEEILDTIDLQKLYSTATEPEEVPCNTKACGDFGGCPFLAICPRPRPDYNRTLQTRKDVMAKTKFGKSSTPAPSTPAPPTPAPEQPDTVTHAHKVVLAMLRANVKNPAFIKQLGIVDEEMTRVLKLTDGAKLLFNMGHPVEPSTINDPAYTSWVEQQLEKASKTSPPDARENHEPGANINDKTGDEISDLEAADITPKTLQGLQSLGCTTLSDVSAFTEAQINKLPYVGGKALEKLRAVLNEAGYDFMPEGAPAPEPKAPPSTQEPKAPAPEPKAPPSTQEPKAPPSTQERMRVTVGHTYQPAPYESVKVEVTAVVLEGEDVGDVLANMDVLLEELTQKEMAKHQ